MIKRIKKQDNENNNKKTPFLLKALITLGIITTLVTLVISFVRGKVSTILAEENTEELSVQNFILNDVSFPQYTLATANDFTDMAFGTSNFTLVDNNGVPLRFTTTDTEFLNGAKGFYINAQITRMTNTMYMLSLSFYSDQQLITELFKMTYTTTALAPYMIYRTGYSSSNYAQANNILRLQEGGFRISGSHTYKPTTASTERQGNAIVSKDSPTYYILTKVMQLGTSWTDMQETYQRGYNDGVNKGFDDGVRQVVGNPKNYDLYTKEEYNKNYQTGYDSASNGLSMNWFTMIFSTISSVLSMKMFGDISLGMIVLIPFSITFVWFIVKSFRGGD